MRVVFVCVAGSSLKVHERRGTFSGSYGESGGSLEITAVTYNNDVLKSDFVWRRYVSKLGQFALIDPPPR